MKKMIVSLTMLLSFSAMANNQLANLQNKHKECIINSGERLYANLSLNSCSQRVDYDATNKRIKEACDKLVLSGLGEASSQAELNLQRDFNSTVYGVSYAILNQQANQHDAKIKNECATLRSLKRSNGPSNFSAPQGVN